MSEPVSETAQARIFTEARTENYFLNRSVPEQLIRDTYDLMKFGPTSANCCPARFVFIQSEAAKERLKPHLMDGNVEKTMAAPWTVIIAQDLDFPEKIPELFPHNPDAKHWFDDPQVRAETAFRNASLQGAYFMMAARALGLDCGPMSGFDRNGIDKEFFRDSAETENWTANFLCNIGYGSGKEIFERSPRLAFETACKVL